MRRSPRATSTRWRPCGPAASSICTTRPARCSFAATAGVDLDRYAAAFAPEVECVDHRTLGTFSARGAEALLRQFGAWLDLADRLAFRTDEILGLRPDALLVRKTGTGTDRAGG